jgi:hypothetical protein
VRNILENFLHSVSVFFSVLFSFLTRYVMYCITSNKIHSARACWRVYTDDLSVKQFNNFHFLQKFSQRPHTKSGTGRICLFLSPTWSTVPLFCNICITLNTSTCLEQYYAHLQEVKIVFLRQLVWSLSMSRSQRVTIPDAVKIELWPPEDEHTFARKMSRYLM